MPSIIGILFFLLSAIFAISKREMLLPLLLFSSIFQAASVLNSDSVGIQPYYLVGLVFIFSSLLSRGSSLLYFSKSEGLLIGFAIYSVWISLFGPHLFAGLPVYDPSIGLDDNFVRGASPLQFSIKNIAQSVYLIINVLIVICAARTKSRFALQKYWHVTFWVLASIVCAQGMFVLLGVPFPWRIINNNQTYSVADPTLFLRPVGTFSEPSYAGAMIASFGSGFLFEFLEGTRSVFPVLLCMALLFVLGSTSAFGAWAFVSVIIILRLPVLRLPWYINLSRAKKYATLLVPAVIGVTLAISSPFGKLVFNRTINKSDSWSYLVRSAADLHAVSVFFGTYGLGAGLGSNRPSGLIVSTLSCVGLAGFALISAFVYFTIRRISAPTYWLRYAFLGLVSSMCLGIPDVNFPGLWMAIALLSNAAKWSKTEAIACESCLASTTLSGQRQP